MWVSQKSATTFWCRSLTICSPWTRRPETVMASPRKPTRKRNLVEVVKQELVSSSGIAIAKATSDFSQFRHVGAVKPKGVKLEMAPATLRGPKEEEEGPEFSQGGCEALLKVVDDLVVALAPLTFKAPVAFVYNPLEYARKPHEEYVRKYGGKKVEVLLVGMNPGPFGMAQTGVPFGDCVLVRDFLHITAEVQTPDKMHPKRPILGFNCPRREVSGQRLWGWAQARFGTASAFLDRFWVHNYCPLMFMETSGKNRTPDKLTASERLAVTSACNAALCSVIDVLQPRLIVGVGKYAGQRVKECAPDGTQVGDIMHPSPANPKANKNWDLLIEAQLQALGVDI